MSHPNPFMFTDSQVACGKVGVSFGVGWIIFKCLIRLSCGLFFHGFKYVSDIYIC